MITFYLFSSSKSKSSILGLLLYTIQFFNVFPIYPLFLLFLFLTHHLHPLLQYSVWLLSFLFLSDDSPHDTGDLSGLSYQILPVHLISYHQSSLALSVSLRNIIYMPVFLPSSVIFSYIIHYVNFVIGSPVHSPFNYTHLLNIVFKNFRWGGFLPPCGWGG